eukprot:m.300329 g.300329  ORF g.300329 m.300329 type:complete len:151 (+) comp40794_c1_seq4:154-606(+)
MAVIRDDLPSCLYFKACVTYYLARAYICTDSFRPFQNAAERMDESLRVFMKECPAGDETIINCACIYAMVLVHLHRFEEASDLLQRMATHSLVLRLNYLMNAGLFSIKPRKITQIVLTAAYTNLNKFTEDIFWSRIYVFNYVCAINSSIV